MPGREADCKPRPGAGTREYLAQEIASGSQRQGSNPLVASTPHYDLPGATKPYSGPTDPAR